MGNGMIAGLAISVCYLLFKFIEMRFVLKENKPLKFLVRDTVLVYLSVILGNFVISQIGEKNITSKLPEVFTNDPGF
jgi:hypothetical protein|tara:strand:+ start:2248 stop:2478 length:231 start_codon:yes stop_codon:yes gene_type:complete